MSRRKTAHQLREGRRQRRALDRAILRAVRALDWHAADSGALVIRRDSTAELVGLAIARKRVG